ncbi:LysM peptidoglycan-binding domain-containing protein [Oscillospiraceae bacterium MB08-C2-2]|nr:LysM peptidoglycan-binding domain-containing protein [Oscillospiraceae bacterium MB08-C2-2]
MQIYVVQRGDTLAGIARNFGVSPAKLITDNGLENQNNLVVGQALLIQFPAVIHTVMPGDTLYGIAREYGTTVISLLQNNPYLASEPILQPGQQITVSYRGAKLGEIFVNGYAYPHINRNVILRVLPFLTNLTIFGYGFTEDGDLIETPDDQLIQLAIQFQVAPIMLLSSITEEGNFSSERASLLFQNVILQNRVIDRILEKMREKGYMGLDVDFEFIQATDREAFIGFVQNITTRLNAEGYTVNVDLAPKVSPDQPGLLYQGHDYPALGAAANTVLLMTYEWGYTYGPPMAVAPIPQVRQVVDYALTAIPAYKMLMGIPNYGYNWILPFEQGVTAATTIGNQYAVQIAAQYGAEIRFDTTAQSPFFEYTDGSGRAHAVWFEDVRSIQAKLNLILEKKLLGAGYWNTMRPFAQNWALINAMFYIRKVTRQM